MSYQQIIDNTRVHNPASEAHDGSHETLGTYTSCQTASPEVLLSQGNPPLPRIHWTDSRISRVLEWLQRHPNKRQALFSDSLSIAREENREVVRNTKNIKDIIHQKIARHVFKNDSKEDMCVAVDHHRKSFGDSVKN